MKTTTASPALLAASEILSKRHFPSMLLLALSAGGVNAGAFAACERFVTHVTGNATRIGIDTGQWLLLFEYSMVLVSFVVGAMASVFAIQGRILKGRSPLHWVPLLGAAGILFLVAAMGSAGAFGPIGSGLEEASDFVFMSLLAFGMGLLNAGVASSTALAVRTTHMTGPATDFGVSLATAWLSQGEERRKALQLAFLRGGKLASFIIGAGLMFPLVGVLGYGAFACPGILVLVATARSFVPAAQGARALFDDKPSTLAGS